MRYLVIGIYEDDGQRWADSFDTETPEEAEALAPTGVIVAGVVIVKNGDMVVVA